MNRSKSGLWQDDCIIVGYHDKLKTQPGKNRVIMKDLHPNDDEQRQKVYCGLFPDHTNKFPQLLQSPEFQQLIKTDATTSNGQQLVAKYFAVDDVWASKKETNTVQAYYELLCLVKTHSTNDSIWFSFREGMHRHAAIIMTLLCANISYNTNNCYVPKTLEKILFHDYIKRYTDPDPCPIEIIQHIFDGTNREAKMLKTGLNVMAYIPTKTETDINKL
jgi:hypothetical protein